MNNFFSHREKYAPFHIFFFISIILTQLVSEAVAVPAGQIVFAHPSGSGEIWIANVDGTNARRIFNHRFVYIHSLSVQKGNRYILVVAEAIGKADTDVYLFDRQKPRTDGKNLTLGRFDWIYNADISVNGDIIFDGGGELYLIKANEIEKPIPKIEKLLSSDVSALDWAPNGYQIVFIGTNSNLFMFDLITNELSKIVDNADEPAFSPNGKQIAFSKSIVREGQLWTEGVAVTSSHINAEPDILHVRRDFLATHPTWSADGQYIAYASYTNLDIQNIELFQAVGNFVVPAVGGEPEPILQTLKGLVWLFEWTNKTYPVEPSDSIVTTWGKLKVGITSTPHMF